MQWIQLCIWPMTRITTRGMSHWSISCTSTVSSLDKRGIHFTRWWSIPLVSKDIGTFNYQSLEYSQRLSLWFVNFVSELRCRPTVANLHQPRLGLSRRGIFFRAVSTHGVCWYDLMCGLIVTSYVFWNTATHATLSMDEWHSLSHHNNPTMSRIRLLRSFKSKCIE